MLLHVLNETQLDYQKLIPSERVEPLLAWLNRLAADSVKRELIAAQTLEGALRRTAADVSELIAELQEQENQLGELRILTEDRFSQALGTIMTRSTTGRCSGRNSGPLEGFRWRGGVIAWNRRCHWAREGPGWSIPNR